jgi:hypothetical protein
MKSVSRFSRASMELKDARFSARRDKMLNQIST